MIRQATTQDASAVAALSLQLWPAHTPEEMTAEFATLLASPEAAVFLAEEGDAAVGFAQCQLHHDYVEGASQSPTGYLEGVYVAPSHQHRGVARALLAACEAWAKAQGCAEFASDCKIDNVASLAFHLHTGFEEAGRIIHFIKTL